MLRRVGVGVSLFVAMTSVQAIDWKAVFTYPDYNTSIDMSSIERKGPISRVWTRTIYTPPQRWSEQPRPVEMDISRDAFNCETKTTWTEVTNIYDKNGNRMISTDGARNEVDQIVPGSNGDKLMRLACAL